MKKKAAGRKKYEVIAVVVLLAFCFVLPSAVQGADTFYLGDHPEKWGSRHVLNDDSGQEIIAANQTFDGGVIIIGGKTYDTGIYMHCAPDDPTYLEIDISGLEYDTFSAEVGVISQADGIFLEWGSVSFRVLLDGEVIASTGVCKYGDAAQKIEADIKGGAVLRLEAFNVDGHACDWAALGNAKLFHASSSEPNTDTGDGRGFYELAVLLLCSGAVFFASGRRTRRSR